MDLHYGSGREYLSDATFLEQPLQREVARRTITTVTDCPQRSHYPQTV